MSATYNTTARSNARLTRTIYDLFNQDKIEEALAYATEDVTLNLYALGLDFVGREGFAAFMQGFKQAFPDLKIEVTNQVADDDQVACEITAVGTHNGPLATPAGQIPPTGKTVHFTVCEVWKIRDGKFYSLHNYQDSASIMRQIGLM
jgi:steroid delta-isomerase-like uncharacterized protein